MKNIKTQWDLNLIISKDKLEKFEQERNLVEQESYKFINKWKDRSDYLENAETLFEALEEYEKWEREIGPSGNEGFYYGLKLSLDQNDTDTKAKSNKLNDFGLKIINDIQFFELKLSKIPESNQKELLEDSKLKKYKHYLEGIFKFSKHILSEPEEKILNLKYKVSRSNWIQMLSALLSKQEREVLNDQGKLEKKNFSEITELLNNKDKKIRDKAADAFNDILKTYSEIAEHEINSVLENKKIEDEIRNYSRPDEGRHLGDDLESEVVDSVVSEVTKRFDIPKRYYALKAKLMGVDKLEYHERNVEYGEIDEKFEFNEAYEVVRKVFANLDPEFEAIYERLFTNGQVDVYPAKGKRSGAFCSSNMVTEPTYIMLNHNDTLNNVLTIAHEFGHAIHFEYSKANQHALDQDIPMCTAETASTFFEDFVLKEVTKTSTDELKLAINMMKLNDEISTIFRQIACYNFELELHQKFREIGYLSLEDLGSIFHKHMGSYMGDSVIQDENSKNWWIYWSHIRSHFYVYSYAFGLLVSKSLQNLVLDDKNTIEKIKDFFKAGSSKSPKQIFADMKIDITDSNFWSAGIDEIEKLLLETEVLAEKLK
jgi:oligoendopeptidase F